MKRIIIAVLMVLMVSSISYAADKKLGISAGVDYVGDYQWRGTSFYGGAGALFPFLSYDIAGTGLVVSYAGEYGDNFLEGSYTGSAAFIGQSADFGLAYGIKIPKIMTIDLSATYLWYYVSGNYGGDLSFLALTAQFSFDVFLSPFISYTHDLYIVEGDYIDFYIQAGISHDFKLAKNATFGLGLTYGYYHAASVDDAVKMDIVGSATLTVEVGDVSVYGGMDLVCTPLATTDGGKLLKMYGKFGASYSL